ncbi:hypothetical protein D3C77_15190 [compost metagenome]|uniref:DUF2950 domain-containing protein n=1 Tax=Pseudomonas TaxID=286 RepID=UPI000CFB99A2|nr:MULTISPECIES: DUF2950 domain-containing protein [unclassified Pseudomonas]MCW2271572.1 hypothetical protein [Pseudomonas sp. JUb96]PRA59492.1 hypothetical protein CQ065_22540 [Pseudomonas sp. MYb187]
MNAAGRFALVVLLLWTSGSYAQQHFPTPERAGEALVQALGSQKSENQQLANLLGNDWKNYIPTEHVDRADVDAFLALYQQKHQVQSDSPDRAHLVVGETSWVFPIPLKHVASGWVFDTRAGAEEIRLRRIGRNELATIQAVRAYHDAQMDYAEIDRNDDGVLEYAQKFISSDGQFDGLYWPEEEGVEESPLGPLFGDAAIGDDWHGYHYRILTAQGPSAPGGAYDYKIGERMTRGFAVIAWPTKYGETGVMSFMISHDGEVFQKDLGRDSTKKAAVIKRFDPDSSWSEVKDEDDAS